MSKRFRLRLKRLDFISAVDTPAQETATAVLLKSGDFRATARVVKTADELGLVFGWALTSKSGGADYFDLQGDNVVEDDLIRVAAEFMENGGATDQQHDFEADGRVVFAMPLTAEVAKSFGIQTDTTGLMVAIKPSADVFAKFKSGEYTGFSIAGTGEREPLAKADEKCPDCGEPMKADHECEPTGIQSKSTRYPVVNDGTITMSEKPTVIVLTDAQHAHYAKLAGAEAEAFLAKSSIERDAVLADIAKSDPIVFKGELTGFEVRKSQGEFALKLAKHAEDSEKRARDSAAATEIEKASREAVELRKRAAETMPNLAGSDDVHCAVLKAVESITDEQTRTEAIQMLKAANDAAKSRSVAKGDEGAAEPKQDAQADLDALIATEQVKEPSLSKAKATERVLATKRGADLYTEIQKRVKARK